MTKKNTFKGKKIKSAALKIFQFLAILVCLYYVLMPFVPQLLFWLKFDIFDYDWSRHENYDISAGSGEQSEEYDEIDGNRIIIPVIGVDVMIVEGNSDTVLNMGAWHRPGTGDPENGGNMVITGHRFQYLPPNNLTFYHLDKIREGDEIIVYWNEIEYDYVVVETFVVDPDSVEIEDQTAHHLLTLYTCTPLWTADKRLVVRAEQLD